MARHLYASDVALTALRNCAYHINRAVGVAVTDVMGAARLVECFAATDRDPEGCILMNLHKAKGQEFDGVVLVEGAYKSGFFDIGRKPRTYEPNCRLLRVGLTRARTLVTLVRPQNARPLVDWTGRTGGFANSPLACVTSI